MKVKTADVSPSQLNLLVAMIENTGIIFEYTTSVAAAWPIIDKHEINLVTRNYLNDPKRKYMAYREGDAKGDSAYGATALEAAMRYHVQRYLGKEVEVLEELS